MNTLYYLGTFCTIWGVALAAHVWQFNKLSENKIPSREGLVFIVFISSAIMWAGSSFSFLEPSSNQKMIQVFFALSGVLYYAMSFAAHVYKKELREVFTRYWLIGLFLIAWTAAFLMS